MWLAVGRLQNYPVCVCSAGVLDLLKRLVIWLHSVQCTPTMCAALLVCSLVLLLSTDPNTCNHCKVASAPMMSQSFDSVCVDYDIWVVLDLSSIHRAANWIKRRVSAALSISSFYLPDNHSHAGPARQCLCRLLCHDTDQPGQQLRHRCMLSHKQYEYPRPLVAKLSMFSQSSAAPTTWS
jgi:hypothetical protein